MPPHGQELAPWIGAGSRRIGNAVGRDASPLDCGQELSPRAATVFASKTPTDGSFRARVMAIVRRIPRGRVATYGDVAALAGRPRAWRAVGTIMRNCRLPSVPCHRVVGAGGRLGGYSDPLRKRRLLQEEGIVVGRGTIQQFDALRWTPPRPRDR